MKKEDKIDVNLLKESSWFRSKIYQYHALDKQIGRGHELHSRQFLDYNRSQKDDKDIYTGFRPKTSLNNLLISGHRKLLEKVVVSKKSDKIVFHFYLAKMQTEYELFGDEKKQIEVIIHLQEEDHADSIQRTAIDSFLGLLFTSDQFFISSQRIFNLHSIIFKNKTGHSVMGFEKPRYIDLLFNSIETFSCSRSRAGKDNQFYHRFDFPFRNLRFEYPNEDFSYIFNLMHHICKYGGMDYRLSSDTEGKFNRVRICSYSSNTNLKEIYALHLYNRLANAYSESFPPTKIENYSYCDIDFLKYNCIKRHNRFEEFLIITSAESQ